MNILYVEDNLGDVVLLKKAFEDNGGNVEFSIARDGVEASMMLNRKGEYSNYKLPDIILLDLNLPKKDGRELLSEIKSNVDLKHLPVLVFTSSKSHKDVKECYRLYASCYISKPRNPKSFDEVVTAIRDFWFSTVELPTATA